MSCSCPCLFLLFFSFFLSILAHLYSSAFMGLPDRSLSLVPYPRLRVATHQPLLADGPWRDLLEAVGIKVAPPLVLLTSLRCILVRMLGLALTFGPRSLILWGVATPSSCAGTLIPTPLCRGLVFPASKGVSCALSCLIVASSP